RGVRQTVKRLCAVRCKMLDQRIEFTAHWPRLVKRRRALLESIPPRNSQLKLIVSDERRGRRHCCPGVSSAQHRNDRFPMPEKLTKKAAAQRPPRFALPTAPRT